MAKRITDGITKVDTVAGFSIGITHYKRCAWCKKRFELLSAEWRYKTKRGGKTYYFCRYNCWTADEKKNSPKQVLRGENCIENMRRYQAERLEIIRERY